MLQMQLLPAASAPISFQLQYTFFMPTQLIVFCAKKCFAVKAEIITPHKRWDCEVYGPDTHTHTHSNKNPACFAFFWHWQYWKLIKVPFGSGGSC